MIIIIIIIVIIIYKLIILCPEENTLAESKYQSLALNIGKTDWVWSTRKLRIRVLVQVCLPRRVNYPNLGYQLKDHNAQNHARSLSARACFAQERDPNVACSVVCNCAARPNVITGSACIAGIGGLASR